MNFESNSMCKKCMIPFPNSRAMIEHWLYFHGINNAGAISDQTMPTDLSMVRKLKSDDPPTKKKTKYKETDHSVGQQVKHCLVKENLQSQHF